MTVSVYEENDGTTGDGEDTTAFYTLIESHALLVSTSSGK